jgi:uncharacterized Tic20 family protein
MMEDRWPWAGRWVLAPKADLEGNEMTESADRDERMWATGCHVAAFAGFVFPFGNLIAPLVVWLLKREQYPLVDDQGRESLNFQITITIYAAITLLLSMVVIGIPLFFAVLIWDLAAVIAASIRANHGERYRYCGSMRIIQEELPRPS